MSNVLATLRRRIPDVVAGGLLLAGGLFLGVELLGWYRTPEPRLSPPPSAMATLNLPGEAADLEFGDLPVSITRVRHAGSLEEARTALADLLRSVVPSAQPLSGDEPAERNMLLALSRRAPFEEQRDEWRVYNLDDRFSTMVVTRPALSNGIEPLPARPPELAPGGAGARANLAGSDLAGWRVVAIGMLAGGLPTDPATGEELAPSWTLYLFRGTAASGASPGKTSPPGDSWPRPAGSQRTMSVRDRNGGGLTAFHGTGAIRAVADFYGPLFENTGFVPDPGWRNSTERVWGRFRIAPNTSDATERTVELLVMSVENGRWSAILSETTTPGVSGDSTPREAPR